MTNNSAQAASNTTLTIGSVIVNNVTNYDWYMSVEETSTTKVSARGTQIWSFVSWSTNVVSQFFTNSSGHSNKMSVMLRDADQDRAGDEGSTNVDLGWFVLYDDDTLGPTIPGIMVYDPFTDTNRTNGTDPFDVAWFIQDTDMVVHVGNQLLGLGNALVVESNAPGFNRRLVAPLSSMGLTNTDDTIVLSFDVRFTFVQAESPNGFRFGLYDANGTVVPGDELISQSSTNDSGYGGRIPVSNLNPWPITIYNESGTNDGISDGTDVSFYSPAYTNDAFSYAVLHKVEFAITKQTNGVLLQLAVDSTQTVSVIETNALFYTNFNEVAFSMGSGGPAGYIIDNVQVAYNPLRLVNVGWTNVATNTVQWSTNRVIDVSGISEFRVTTNGLAPTSDVSGSSFGLVTQATVVITNVGVITNYVFARDTDGDRPDDQQRGNSAQFITRYDNVAPAQVAGLAAANTLSQDEATEIRLAWTALTNAGERSDGAALSPWRTYKLYYEECAVCTPTNYIIYTNGPIDLAMITTTSMVLSNLAFDATYNIQLVGLDSAGNEGPRSSTVITNTTGFVATQGVARLTNDLYVSWTGKVGRAYDVIYFDRMNGWSNGTSNAWVLMDLVTTSVTFNDTGSIDRVHPANLGSTMRFYRVSNKDAWQSTNVPRRATREVYAERALRLVPGENWISLFFMPDTNTVEYVLGTNRLPRALTLLNSTKVSWYGTGSNPATNIIWLSTNSGWQWAVGGAGSANGKAIPLGRAFNVELPPSVPTQRLVLIGQVPTNNPVSTATIQPSGTYNLVSLPMPVRTPLATALNGLQLTGDPTSFMNSDEIRVLSTNGTGSFSSPRMRIWYESDAGVYRFVPGYGSGAANAGTTFMVEPGEMIIIYTKTSTVARVWTNNMLYAAPTKNISP